MRTLDLGMKETFQVDSKNQRAPGYHWAIVDDGRDWTVVEVTESGWVYVTGDVESERVPDVHQWGPYLGMEPGGTESKSKDQDLAGWGSYAMQARTHKPMAKERESRMGWIRHKFVVQRAERETYRLSCLRHIRTLIPGDLRLCLSGSCAKDPWSHR